MKTFNRVFTVIVFLFLYIPMIVLAVASFNAGTDIAVWKGSDTGENHYPEYSDYFIAQTLV